MHQDTSPNKESIESKESEEFSIVKRAKSFTHAWRGIAVFIRTTHNTWIHLAILTCATVAGFYFHITTTDWMLLVFAAGLVLTTEAINTAIEIDIDLTSPDYHPFARDTKDVAAGAVLIAATTAAIIGILIFVPYIFV
jgi:diacylglycerol kinase (ATP)